MTKKIAAAAILCLGLAGPVLADDAHHPEKAGQTAAAAGAKPAVGTVRAMQGNVARMQKQLRRIAAAKGGDERQQLMAEHMQTLHESMTMAEGMMHSDGEACPMMGGMMGGKGGMMSGMGQPGGMEERMRQMEMRMQMMEKRLPPAESAGKP